MLLALLVLLSSLLFALYWREWRNRELTDARAERWRVSHADQVLLRAMERAEFERRVGELNGRIAMLNGRLYEIRTVITRRPPRRRWLRIAHRVAGLADA